MKQLRLLPLQVGETVDQKVAAFRGYSDEVRRCLPDVLLATMNILFTQYKQVRWEVVSLPDTSAVAHTCMDCYEYRHVLFFSNFSASSPRIAFTGPGQDGGQETVSSIPCSVADDKIIVLCLIYASVSSTLSLLPTPTPLSLSLCLSLHLSTKQNCIVVQRPSSSLLACCLIRCLGTPMLD